MPSSRCRRGRARCETLALLRRLWRRYDLALSTQAGDRPTLFAWAAGRRSAGFVDPEKLAVHVKRRALDVAVPVAPMLHRVTEVLRLAQALGIAPVAEVVAPLPSATRAPQDERRGPMRWSMSRRNSATSNGPSKAGAPSRPALPRAALRVVATGGPEASERRYLDAVWAGRPEVERLDGALSWPRLPRCCATRRSMSAPIRR